MGTITTTETLLKLDIQREAPIPVQISFQWEKGLPLYVGFPPETAAVDYTW